MIRGLICLFLVISAVAQERDEARRRLEAMAVESPEFPGLVRHTSELYSNALMTAEARAVLRRALDRAAHLPQSHPTRILLLDALADSWEQDGNLLQTAECLEKVAMAVESV